MTILTGTRGARTPMLPLAIGGAVALVIGMVVPGLVDAVGDGYAKLAALPALIALAVLIVFSRASVLLLIVLVRATTESLFEASRFSLGGAQIGLGGLLNAFAIIVAAMMVAEYHERFTRSIAKMWAPFLLMLLFGTWNSPDTPAAIRLLLQHLSNFAIFVGAYLYLDDEEQFRSAIRLVLWGSIGPVLYGIVQFATGGGYTTPDAGLRTNSTFNHPNIFAFYLTIVISLAFYMMKSASAGFGQRGRFALGAYIVVLIALLLLTKTRSAWVATFAVFLGYAVLFERRYFIYLFVGGGLALLIPDVGGRLFDLTQGTTQVTSYDVQNSFAWRVSLWTSALTWMTAEHYVYGYGLEAFKWFAPVFFGDWTKQHWGAHNVYVQLIFDIGLLGLGAFVWLYAHVLLRLRPLLASDRKAAYFVGMLVIEFLVVAYSDNMLDYQSYLWYLWFVAGTGMAVVARRDERALRNAALGGRATARPTFAGATGSRGLT